MITLLDPQRLWLLAVVAAVAVAYVRGRRRPATYAVTLSTTRFAAEARRRAGPRRWRHLPVAAFLALLALLVVGFARPAVEARVPTQAVEVVVALDTSASMTATDVAPSRLGAAREAAAQFVRELPDEARVGVVAFSGGASLAVAPTTDRDAALDAIASAQGPGAGTAIGEAVGVATSALARGATPPTGDAGGAGGGAGAGAGREDGEGPARDTGRRVVVLSDGNSTAGRPVEAAAQEAATAGVLVDTVAFGTASGSVTVNGETVPVPVEDASLTQLAEATGGEVRQARDAGQLAQAYADIAGSIEYRTEQRELTGLVGALAAVLAVLVALLGLRRASVLPSTRRPTSTGTPTGTPTGTLTGTGTGAARP